MNCIKGFGKPFSNKIRHGKVIHKAESMNPFSDDEKEDSENGKELKESPELYVDFVTGEIYEKGGRNSVG